MYTPQWFMTVFTYNMPFSIVLRIWDVFLEEGTVPKIVVFFRLTCFPFSSGEQAIKRHLVSPSLFLRSLRRRYWPNPSRRYSAS